MDDWAGRRNATRPQSKQLEKYWDSTINLFWQEEPGPDRKVTDTVHHEEEVATSWLRQLGTVATCNLPRASKPAKQHWHTESYG